MLDRLASDSVAHADGPAIRAVLDEVCRLTRMGFAAVARVTEERWIACQVLDRIDFGLKPGDELALKTTICDDIRQSGEAVVIDYASADLVWQTHATPRLYGFESYASFPIYLDDGSFYGTLCAIDPAPHEVSDSAIVATMRRLAQEVATILSRPVTG